MEINSTCPTSPLLNYYNNRDYLKATAVVQSNEIGLQPVESLNPRNTCIAQYTWLTIGTHSCVCMSYAQAPGRRNPFKRIWPKPIDIRSRSPPTDTVTRPNARRPLGWRIKWKSTRRIHILVCRWLPYHLGSLLQLVYSWRSFFCSSFLFSPVVYSCLVRLSVLFFLLISLWKRRCWSFLNRHVL